MIRDALAGHRDGLVGRLGGVLGDTNADPGQRFRAACVLATYDPSALDDWSGARFVLGNLPAETRAVDGALAPWQALVVALG